jgi:hypothetical protein
LLTHALSPFRTRALARSLPLSLAPADPARALSDVDVAALPLPPRRRTFVRGRQEDAHELLRTLLDAVERDGLAGEGRWPPPRPPPGAPPGHADSAVARVFGGLLQSQARGAACGFCSRAPRRRSLMARRPSQVGGTPNLKTKNPLLTPHRAST